MRFFTPSSDNDNFWCKSFKRKGKVDKMPTIKEVLNRVNLPGISDSIKCRWLGELDGKRYEYPEDLDIELLYEYNIYEKYLRAMDDFFNGNMSAYERSAREFRTAFENRKDVRQ